MGRKRLPNLLVIVQHADLLPNPLRDPDGASIRLDASSANIPMCPLGHQVVSGNKADAPIKLGLSQCLSEVGAFHCANVIAFPYVLILVRSVYQVALPIALQLGGELRVITPVQLDNLHQRII